MHDVSRLDVYEDSIAWAVDVYRYAQTLPADERRGIGGQLRRAAVSVPSNVAEGAGRGGPVEFARFVRIAIGSVFEVLSQLEICSRLDIGDRRTRSRCVQRGRVLQLRLNALARSLNESAL